MGKTHIAFSIQPKIKLADVKKQSKWWYDQQKKAKVLPINSVYADAKIEPLKFTDKSHLDWFAEVLQLGDYVLASEVFKVEFEPEVVICRYKNETVEGYFKIHLESGFISPLQKNLIFNLFETLSLL